MIWRELTRSSPIGGRELVGHSLEVAGSSSIGGPELVESLPKVCRGFIGSLPTGDQELAGGSPKGCSSID
ncbi:hypothetical protein BHM03_00054266 [Ensete ventricosum]|nr:hypothetical protein BHM03_00054266 [Ensete ventricosum]